MKKSYLIILTPIFVLLSHYLTVFPHEFCHSFMAYFLGDKANPFNLEYGGTHWTNLVFLANIDENVDYKTIFFAGQHWHVALIAFAGPGIANGLMFIASLLLLRNKKIQAHVYWFYFLFWFNLMNLGNFYDYIPIRTFVDHGDMGHFAMGLGISPWWVYVIGSYIVGFLIWQFYTKTLITTYVTLNLSSITAKAIIMILSTYILFKYFGGSGMHDYGDISHFLAATSILAIPAVIAFAWPTRQWVKRAITDAKIK